MKSAKKQLILNANEDSDPTTTFIILKLRCEIWQFSDQVMDRIDYAIKNKILGLIKDESKTDEKC